MNNRKNSKSLKVLTVISVIFLLAFIGAFVAFGLVAGRVDDADIGKGFGAYINYLFKAFPSIWTFRFHNPKSFVCVALSGGLYFVLAVALFYLIVGSIIAAKKKSGGVVIGIVASLLAIPVYFILAAGLPKYYQVVRAHSSDALAKLQIPTFVLLGCGAIFIILSYVLYFVSVYKAFANANEEAQNQEESTIGTFEENSQPVAESTNEAPVMFESVETESTPDSFEPEPEPEAPAAEQEEKESNQNDASDRQFKAEDKEDLKALLREIVRDIVRDEIARNNANQSRNDNPLGPVTGATFGGPLVVQYFNGGINSTTPNQEQAGHQPVSQQVVQTVGEEQPKEEPTQVVEEDQEPAPAAESAPESVEVVPVEPAPEQPEAEKKPIIRIPFTERMLNADKEMQNNYNELKNEILSYGVNSRVSNSGDTFRLHRKTYIKITIAGLSLKLYFALNPEDYKDSSLPIQNAGHKGIYAEIPLVFKVKSGLSMRRCKQLIQDVFDKNGLEQGEVGNLDWVKELKDVAINNGEEE